MYTGHTEIIATTTRHLLVTYSKLHKAFLCTMKLQFIALVALAVANPSLAKEMRGSKMHQQEDHCVPEGIFTCTAVATIYNVAEAKFVNGEVETGESTFRRILEDGTPLAPGHYLQEHPSFFVQGAEMSACALKCGSIVQKGENSGIPINEYNHPNGRSRDAP